MIRNGYEAHFGWINGLAIDDDDRLFVSDGKMRRVLIFNTKHEVESQITEGLVDPVGLAIDTTNRFLYVVDTQQDQVIVYDADTLKLLAAHRNRRQESLPDNAGGFRSAAGRGRGQGRERVCDRHLNNRVEIFDADGKFISQFGKHGDGPGYLHVPKESRWMAMGTSGWLTDGRPAAGIQSRRAAADLCGAGSRRAAGPVQSAEWRGDRQANRLSPPNRSLVACRSSVM